MQMSYQFICFMTSETREDSEAEAIALRLYDSLALKKKKKSQNYKNGKEIHKNLFIFTILGIDPGVPKIHSWPFLISCPVCPWT